MWPKIFGSKKGRWGSTRRSPATYREFREGTESPGGECFFTQIQSSGLARIALRREEFICKGRTPLPGQVVGKKLPLSLFLFDCAIRLKS